MKVELSLSLILLQYYQSFFFCKHRIRYNINDLIKQLDKLLGENPNLGQAHFIKALAHFNLKELELANASVDEALELIPNDTNVHTLKARLLMLKGEYAGAKEEIPKDVPRPLGKRVKHGPLAQQHLAALGLLRPGAHPGPWGPR